MTTSISLNLSIELKEKQPQGENSSLLNRVSCLVIKRFSLFQSSDEKLFWSNPSDYFTIKRCMEIAPEEKKWIYAVEAAKCSIINNEPQTAIDDLLEVDVLNYNVFCLRGLGYEKLEKFYPTLIYYGAASALLPEDHLLYPLLMDKCVDAYFSLTKSALSLDEIKHLALVATDKLIDILKSAARAGCLNAKVNLGCCYYAGIDVEKNYDRAREFFEQASYVGHARADAWLGYWHHQRSDKETGLSFFEKAAQLGDAMGKFYLAMFKYEGQAQLELLQEAAELGYVEAGLKLATRDLKMYRRLGDKGCLQALSELADAYYWGIKVTRNRKKGFELYLRAAKFGHAGSDDKIEIFKKFGWVRNEKWIDN